ncbi:Tigger transposable element-derived protein 6-like [Oopsacas minuta]|uniref:Tigger transposable element-derived protein 6-like n=1 Tax=Oopsacas minuta TaxID=111878 RepID=A0AAV7K009_9METZ|nr:Tigger transposable element-derived protein 6-like [Oopsacas minuta]
MKKASNGLSVLNKVAVAKELQAGVTHASLVLKYETSEGTVGRIREKRQQWLDLDIECMDKKRKRIEKKKTPDEIENKLLQFINTSREKNCIVTGPILQAMALRIVKDTAGQEEFKASNGWLEAFRLRHHIVTRVLSGQRAFAPVEHAEDYKANTLPEILSQ